METVEEHSVITTEIDVVKPNIIEEVCADQSNVCHKTNGVDSAEPTEGGHSDANDVAAEKQPQSDVGSQPESKLLGVETDGKSENVTIPDNVEPISESTEPAAAPETELDIPTVQTDLVTGEPELEPDSKTEIEVQHNNEIGHVNEIPHEVVSETVEEVDREICIEEEIVTETMVEMESSVTTVHFETEVLVEVNDNEVDTEAMSVNNKNNDQTNNILNELGPNIELSEVLRSSDISENVENNNSSVKQEIFNKEELLDILEGNDDMEQPDNKVQTSTPNVNRDAEKALLQLSRLSKLTRKKGDLKSPKIKRGEKTKSPLKDKGKNFDKEKQQQMLVEEKKQLDNKLPNNQADSTEQQSQVDEEQGNNIVNKEQELQEVKKQQVNLQETQPDSIVKSLVMDWEDEPTENNEVSDIIQESEHLIKDSEELKNKQESIVSNNDTLETSVTDSPNVETQEKLTKTDVDGRTRRISRVIKKKVIFDPDNPDTFTKGKSKPKEALGTKEQTPSKKPKTDQVIQRSKSKSPLSKLQWKKPSTKNSKQHRRLTEVDKLLMDEGAVNMIYQLTPEAPKGKKNVKTKAEFIKKLQSSTPDSKEMKFRERKKESKYEDGEARKLLGGKHRPSLSSSVKSPCVSEDFETHSADDSIIYRRHSSSSYSSSCMSPRRLSDVEAGSTQGLTRISQPPISKFESDQTIDKQESVFQTEVSKISSNEMINKNDCLNIKEKLNSKLSLALNKRKRENSKIDKPAKQKKQENIACVKEDRLNQFKYISVTFDQRLALVCIKKTGVKICVEILKELDEALNYVDSKSDISITLLESQCGTLCSSLDLSLLLGENKEIIVNHAYELAESVRSLLVSVAQHSKLVCCGVWGACAGVALALVALSDVALASEGASFWLAAAAAPLLPGAAALTARCHPLPQALVNDLVIFGRRLSASEALQGGLVSRVLWPDRFDEQVQHIAKDIAAQPLQTILLKKRLLSLKSNSEAQLTFLSCLETERDLLVEYWTSVEGQELLRATLDAA